MPNLFISFIFILLISACSEKIDYSTPAQAHIDEYMNIFKKCKEWVRNSIISEKKDLPSTTNLPQEQSIKPFNTYKDINNNDIILGDENSNIVLIGYFSPTCPHCAYFHKNIFPEIKKKYLDTNKITYIIREFISNKQDLDAATLARCKKNKEEYFKYTEVILQQQDSWALSNKYREILTNIGQLGGISPEQYSECLNDNELVEILINNTKTAAKAPKFIGTPAFFLNGVLLENAYTLNALSDSIEQAIKKLNTKKD